MSPFFIFNNSTMNAFVHWLQDHMLTCPSKKLFGISCPGCGMQRAFIELLQGNVMESLRLYPALIPIMITFCLLAAHLIFKYRKGAKYVMWSFIISAAIIFTSFIVKVSTGEV
jgi:hypothetical protein